MMKMTLSRLKKCQHSVNNLILKTKKLIKILIRYSKVKIIYLVKKDHKIKIRARHLEH